MNKLSPFAFLTAVIFLFFSAGLTAFSLKNTSSVSSSQTLSVIYHLEARPIITLDAKEITEVKLSDLDTLDRKIINVKFPTKIFAEKDLIIVLAKRGQPKRLDKYNIDESLVFSISAAALFNNSNLRDGDRLIFGSRDGKTLYFTIGLSK